MSDSAQPHRQQPTRLPRPWDPQGKNVGVRCHFLLQCMKVKSESEVAQSCPTLCDPVDCVAHQAPPSMGFSRQEYWSGVPLPSLICVHKSPHIYTCAICVYASSLVYVCMHIHTHTHTPLSFQVSKAFCTAPQPFSHPSSL